MYGLMTARTARILSDEYYSVRKEYKIIGEEIEEATLNGSYVASHQFSDTLDCKQIGKIGSRLQDLGYNVDFVDGAGITIEISWLHDNGRGDKDDYSDRSEKES